MENIEENSLKKHTHQDQHSENKYPISKIFHCYSAGVLCISPYAAVAVQEVVYLHRSSIHRTHLGQAKQVQLLLMTSMGDVM